MIHRPFLRFIPVVLFCMSASAARGDLAESIRAVIEAPEYRGASWGILVAELDSGKTLFEFNADKLFRPASTTKLYTVASALDALGADYRFVTPVRRRGEVDANGVLHGDLILVASGDLNMGGRAEKGDLLAFRDHDHTYAGFYSNSEITPQDPLAGLNTLASAIRESGIRRVDGDVLIDDRLFDSAEGTGSGPRRISPILINDNLIDITIRPGSAGSTARVQTRPETSAFRVDAQVDTVDAKAVTTITVTSPGAGRIVVRGQIAADHKPMLRVFEVEDPASFARTLLIEALRRAGISTTASALGENKGDALPSRDSTANLPQVAALKSAPFREAAKLILKVSHNLHASTLPLIVAAKGGGRTLDDGFRKERDFLKRASVDVDSISFGSGAGGSPADLTSPRATVQLLRYMSTRPDFEAYHKALPVLGVDGTLADAVDAKSTVRGKVQAKTGTLAMGNPLNGGAMLTSKAMAGYLTAANGKKLAFVIYLNNVPIHGEADMTRHGRTLGLLCEIIHREVRDVPRSGAR